MTKSREDFFREFVLSICSSLKLGTALERCWLSMRDSFPCSHLSIHLPVPEQNRVHILARAGNVLETSLLPQCLHFPESIKNKVASLWEKLATVTIVSDLSRHPVYTPLIALAGIKTNASAIILRLELENNRIASFWVVHNQPGRFAKDHENLLTSIHDPLALAILNSHEYKKLAFLSTPFSECIDKISERAHQSSRTIVGESSGLKGVMDLVHQVAPYASPVLLTGETGVGKEVIASAIHTLSKRHEHPFIKVNCGAIQDSLVDSELFGHEKGSFTGAHERKTGRFERAQGGTIFLDEISEMTEMAQLRLLRVLQNREMERVGGTKTLKLDVRVIAAANKDLKDLVDQKKFREDLWFRLNIFPIHIPPLRMRKKDINSFVDYFLEKKCRELNIINKPGYTPDHIKMLKSYHWPGNVRELENTVERAIIRHRNGMISLEAFQDSEGFSASHQAQAAALSLDEVIIQTIREALIVCRGKVHGEGGAAERLRVHPNTLRNKMLKYKIDKNGNRD